MVSQDYQESLALKFRTIVQRRSGRTRLGLVVALVVAMAHVYGQSFAKGAEGGNVWQISFEKAERLAKESKAPLLIHFSATWCGPCRIMEAEVLSKKEVLAALQSGIVGVKVDSDQHPELISRFGISALPSDVIVGVNGRVLSKTVGNSGLRSYLANLSKHSVRPTTSSPVAPSVKTIIAQAPAVAPSQAVQVTAQYSPRIAEASAGIPQSAVVALNQVGKDDLKLAAVSNTSAGAGEIEKKSDTVLVSPKPAPLTKSIRKEADVRIGLNGFSPVALIESEKWKTGAEEFKHEIEGVCYLLTSAEELEKFKANPKRFIPALHGCDPVALVNNQVIQTGHIELGLTYGSRIYFFATKASRDLFLSNPAKFSDTYHVTFQDSNSSKG